MKKLNVKEGARGLVACLDCSVGNVGGIARITGLEVFLERSKHGSLAIEPCDASFLAYSILYITVPHIPAHKLVNFIYVDVM